MTDKRAFEALLDDLLGASFDQDWPAEKKARAAVLAAYDAAHSAKAEAVRLPFRQELCSDTGPLDAAFVRGWNACLDAIAASPARGGEGER